MNGKASEKKPLSALDVRLAVGELRMCTALQLEAVQAMLDGVTLGAEQVQDKRIEFLERGPTVDPVDNILLFALVVILESSVGGLVARAALMPITRGIMGAVRRHLAHEAGQLRESIRLFSDTAMQMAQESSKLRASGARRRAWREWKFLAQDLERVTTSLEGDLRGKREAVKAVRSVIDAVTSKAPELMVAGVKGVREVLANPGNVGYGDPAQSPGVSVRASAMAAAARLRFAVKASHEMLEIDLHKPDIMREEAEEILALQRPGADLDVATLTLTFQFTTEAMIWAKLLMTPKLTERARARRGKAEGAALDMQRRAEAKDKAMRAPYGVPDPGQPPRAMEDEDYDDPLLLGVDEQLGDYLALRLEPQVLAWMEAEPNRAFRNRMNGRGGPDALADASNPRAWPDHFVGEVARRMDSQDLLVQYFAAVAEMTPEFKMQ